MPDNEIADYARNQKPQFKLLYRFEVSGHSDGITYDLRLGLRNSSCGIIRFPAIAAEFLSSGLDEINAYSEEDTNPVLLLKIGDWQPHSLEKQLFETWQGGNNMVSYPGTDIYCLRKIYRHPPPSVPSQCIIARVFAYGDGFQGSTELYWDGKKLREMERAAGLSSVRVDSGVEDLSEQSYLDHEE